MTDPDEIPLAVMRPQLRASKALGREVDLVAEAEGLSPPINVYAFAHPDKDKVHLGPSRLAAVSAFMEADRWVGVFRAAGDEAYKPPPHAENRGLHDAARIMGIGLRADLARVVLEKAKTAGGVHHCALADPDDRAQVDALAAEIEEHAPLLWSAVGMDKAPPSCAMEAREVDPTTGVLVWDERLARYLEQLGGEGGLLAATIRDQSIDPRQSSFEDPIGEVMRLWRLWTAFPASVWGESPYKWLQRDDVREGVLGGIKAERERRTKLIAAVAAGAYPDDPRLARACERVLTGPSRETPKAWLRLGWALWSDVVRARFARVGAMDLALFQGVRAMVRPGNRPGDGDDRIAVLSREGATIGFIDRRALEAINADPSLVHATAAADLKALASPAFKKLLYLSALTIARQQKAGDPLWHIVRLPGVSELRTALGNPGAGELESILRAGHRFEAAKIGGGTIGGLFLVETFAPAAGRPAAVVLQWRRELFTANKNLLVGLPHPDLRGPLLGNRVRGQVEQAVLWLHEHFQRHSRDLAKRGDVRIGPKDWEEMRRDAGMTGTTARKMPDALAKPKKKQGEPVLVLTRPGRYRLVDDALHDFLVEQGKRREHQAGRGKVGSEVRGGTRPPRRKR